MSVWRMPCPFCRGTHRLTALVPDPDHPAWRICPVRRQTMMRLTSAERGESDRLLRLAFGIGGRR